MKNTLYWNVVQVASWIISRDRERINELDEHALKRPPTMMSLWEPANNSKDQPIRFYPDTEEIIRKIETALRLGELTARGLRNGAGNPKKIPPWQWSYLALYDGLGNYDSLKIGVYAAPRDIFRPGAPTKWYDLKIRSSEVMKLWKDDQRTAPAHLHRNTGLATAGNKKKKSDRDELAKHFMAEIEKRKEEKNVRWPEGKITVPVDLFSAYFRAYACEALKVSPKSKKLNPEEWSDGRIKSSVHAAGYKFMQGQKHEGGTAMTILFPDLTPKFKSQIT